MPIRDSKLAEREYLSRSGSLPWELVKPFSPPATDTLAESTRLIHDFSVGLAALDVSGSHRVLDLGAGSCWTSEWLRRLNLNVVSVDIALDMLRAGRRRSESVFWDLVAGDLEQLPFLAKSFDRALCLNALHHVPQPMAALQEIARVLTDSGRLVLIEPGAGHSNRGTSLDAVHKFGVLEQELEATTLMELCLQAGFTNVVLRPMSYVSGEIELSLEEFGRWRQWTRTKRPLRAIRKLWRAILEFGGMAKAGVLLEDALSMWTSRVLMRHTNEQPVVVATKSAYQPANRDLRAVIQLSEQAGASSGDVTKYRIRIENAGTLTWRAHGRGRVQLGVQLANAQEIVINRDFLRVSIPHDVDPGGDCTVQFDVPLARSQAAAYLKLDLVAEDITWFESAGSSPLVIAIRS
jgi:SAM-dependent methyltransferase